jgi:hypothetical protein
MKLELNELSVKDINSIYTRYSDGVKKAQKRLEKLFKNSLLRNKGEKYGVVSINEIIKAIYENNPLMMKFSIDYDNKILNCKKYISFLLSFESLYIDISLQREIDLEKTVKDIIRCKGFNEALAEDISVFYRHCYDSDKEYGFIADGFRRTIMSILVGKNNVRAFKFNEDKNDWSEDQCAINEAEFFILKNKGHKSTSFEEEFKADVRRNETDAVKVRDILNAAGLDIENIVNPYGVKLKKLSEIYKILLMEKPKNKNVYTNYYTKDVFIKTVRKYIDFFKLTDKKEHSPNIDDFTALCRLTFKIENGYMYEKFNLNYSVNDLYENLKIFVEKVNKKQGKLTLGRTTQGKNKTAELIALKNLFNINNETVDKIKKTWNIEKLI